MRERLQRVQGLHGEIAPGCDGECLVQAPLGLDRLPARQGDATEQMVRDRLDVLVAARPGVGEQQLCLTLGAVDVVQQQQRHGAAGAAPTTRCCRPVRRPRTGACSRFARALHPGTLRDESERERGLGPSLRRADAPAAHELHEWLGSGAALPGQPLKHVALDQQGRGQPERDGISDLVGRRGGLLGELSPAGRRPCSNSPQARMLKYQAYRGR